YGALGAVIGVSVAIGPVLGGFIIELAGPDSGWRWTFLVNILVGVVAIVLALLWIPRAGPRQRGGRSVLRVLAPVGGVLLGLAVLALLWPFVERSMGAAGWLLVPAGAGLLALWAVWERWYRARGNEPMVDLSLFRIRSFSTGNLIAGLYFMGVTSVWVLVAM